jgi:hypothetical protein
MGPDLSSINIGSSSLHRHILASPVSSDTPLTRLVPIREPALRNMTVLPPLHSMLPEHIPMRQTHASQPSQVESAPIRDLHLLALAAQQSDSHPTPLPPTTSAFPMAMQTPVDRRDESPVQTQEKGKQRYQSPVQEGVASMASASRSSPITTKIPAFPASRESSSSIPLPSLLPISGKRKNLENPAPSQNISGIGQVSNQVEHSWDCLRLG